MQLILANHERFLGEDLHVSLKSIILINTIALKSSNKFREHLKSLKLIELRDKLLVDQLRKTYTHICDGMRGIGGKELNEVYINAICSSFDYGQLASKTIFTTNFGAEYLTLVSLLIGELAEEFPSNVKYSEYAKQLKARVKVEVMQFSENITSPELSAYYQGEGDTAFFSRLRDFLSHRVSAHMEGKRDALKAVQQESLAQRKAFNDQKFEAEQV